MSTERKGTRNKIKNGYGNRRQHIANAYILPDMQLNSICLDAKIKVKYMPDGTKQWPRNQMFGIDPFSAALDVVEGNGLPIIGQPACQAKKLITIYCDYIMDSASDITSEGLKETQPNLFDSLGDFKETTQLYVKA